MSYIKLEECAKFSESIYEVMGILSDANDTPYIKGEYFGFFLNRLVRRFLADPNYTQNSFNSAMFNESKKKTLINASDSIAAMINRSDPIVSAGELHYAVSAIMVGYFGGTGLGKLSYGVMTYWIGIVERVSAALDTYNTGGSQRDVTMAFRRQLVIRGVLSNVIRAINHTWIESIDGMALPIWQEGKLIYAEGTK
jgi:hypothetical protein